MPKVYISPSVQTYNLCEYGDTEKDHCQLYADILQRYFQACGIEYKRNMNKTFQEAVAESNAWNPDIHYACHTNAYNGQTKYSVLLVYNAVEGNPAYDCAQQIKQLRPQVYPDPIYVNQNRSLYEIRYSTNPCVYDEIVFHDNVDNATLFHVRMQTFAELTTRGFCNYFGIPFVYPEGVGLEPGVSDTEMTTGAAPAGIAADAIPTAAAPAQIFGFDRNNEFADNRDRDHNRDRDYRMRYERLKAEMQRVIDRN